MITELAEKRASRCNMAATGKPTVVVGDAGSGKSSLLSTFLGEMMQVSGSMYTTRYRYVVAACALQPDIDQLPAGDNTKVGEQGYPLTDGQKQQICVARALYSEAEAVLLVIVLADGRVHFQGKVWEVKKFDPDLYDCWRKVLRDVKASEFRTSSLQNVERKHSEGSQVGPARTSSLQNVERKHSGDSQVGPNTLSRPSSTQSKLSLLGLPMSGRKIPSMSVMSEASNEDAIDDGLNITANGEHKMSAGPVDSDVLEEKLLKPELRETGAVHISIYLQYFPACSITLCLMSFFLQPRVYVNKTGNFVTGVDITSEEASEKREKRAQRFGTLSTPKQPITDVDIKNLHKSLGMSTDTLDQDVQGWRTDTIMLRGTENMSTKDVFDYFSEYAPNRVQ